MDDPRPTPRSDDPDPLSKPEQLPNDDDLGEADARHRGPSEAATADIKERQRSRPGEDAQPGRPPEDAPDY